MLRFEWDEVKNKRNRRKHGIWFEEAQSVFDDPNANFLRIQNTLPTRIDFCCWVSARWEEFSSSFTASEEPIP